MTLLYKPDCEETKQRYIAWWNHEYFGRCALVVRAPKAESPDTPEPPLHISVRQKWNDLEHIDRWKQCSMSRTFFRAEAEADGGHPFRHQRGAVPEAPLG